MVFLDKFGRHMVNAFRDEGIARFGLDAYRYQSEEDNNSTSQWDAQLYELNCMFLSGKERELPWWLR